MNRESLSNPGHWEHWTCPCCFQDMDDMTPGIHPCPKCGARINCERVTQCVCVSTQIDEACDDREI